MGGIGCFRLCCQELTGLEKPSREAAGVIKARDAKASEQGDARRNEMEGWSEVFQKKNKILPQVNHPAVRSPFRLLNKNTIDLNTIEK